VVESTRYLRVKTPEIEPLWATEISPLQVRESLSQDRICRRCGSQRTAEFQIIPTLLSSLNHPSSSSSLVQEKGKQSDGEEGNKKNCAEGEEEEMDFGTIVVFTCPRSCSPPDDDDDDDDDSSQNSPPSSPPTPTLDHPSLLSDSSLSSTSPSSCWTPEIALVQTFSNHSVFPIAPS
jgi:hypothetical protein